MKTKPIVTVLLLAFVAVSLGVMVVKEHKKQAATGVAQPVEKMPGDASAGNADNAPAPTEAPSSVVRVYYFHGNLRCPTCLKLESYAKNSVDANFADLLKAGKLVWMVVNVETPENSHFIDDFSLVTKSVVLAECVDGKTVRWKNLDEIWDRVDDQADYEMYIRGGINEFLAKGSAE